MTATAPAKTHLPLPEERDDPLEAMLDMIEANLQAGLAADLGPQLEARILRLFPLLMRAPLERESGALAPGRGRGMSGCAAGGATTYSDIDRAVRLVNALHFVKGSRASGAEAHAETLQAEIDRLRTWGEPE